MIHDAEVEVTCDGKHCSQSVRVRMRYVYTGVMHTIGKYDDDDSEIEKSLIKEFEWIVKDGKHYCSQPCSQKK